MHRAADRTSGTLRRLRPARLALTDIPARWAHVVLRRWRIVLGAWLLFLLIAGAGAAGLTRQLSGGGWYVPGSHSQQALTRTAEGFVGRGRTTLTLVTRDGRHSSTEAEFIERATEAYRFVAENPALDVSTAYGWATSSASSRAAFVGDSGRTTVTTLGLNLPDGDARRELPAIQHAIDDRFAGQDLQVALVGPAAVWGEVNVLSERGLVRAELLALPLLLLILLWLYRGWVAATLSLLVAATCVTWTLGILSLIIRYVELSVFVQNAVTMLGLGVAVDYSLFLVARFREQVLKGEVLADAVVATLRTAGHTVVSSGATVCLAMGTLFLIDLPVIRSLGLGAVVVVIIAIVVNVAVLPALLVAFAARVAPPRGRHEQPSPQGKGWARWAHLVMRRPVAALLVGGAALGCLAVPAGELSTFTPDARIIGSDVAVRAGWDTLRADYGPGAAGPILVVVHADHPLAELPQAPRLLALPQVLDEVPGVVRVVSPASILKGAGAAAAPGVLTPQGRAALPPDLAKAVGNYLSEDGRTMLLEVVPDGLAASPEARGLVDELRGRVDQLAGPGVTVVVGGETAEGIDSTRTIAAGLPRVALTMLVVIYLVLLVTFRSVLLPLKAIAMNAASVAATYGVMVVVFQHGVGAGLLGVEPTGQITNFIPVLMLTLLFGLSTDYEVFLLSRVREEWLLGADDRTAVAKALAVTAPLISGAAILMVAVFSAFTLASVLPIQELGFGMAVAIILDATLVRLLLVPASMRLMGRWNWWFPRVFASQRRPQEPTIDTEDNHHWAGNHALGQGFPAVPPRASHRAGAQAPRLSRQEVGRP